MKKRKTLVALSHMWGRYVDIYSGAPLCSRVGAPRLHDLFAEINKPTSSKSTSSPQSSLDFLCQNGYTFDDFTDIYHIFCLFKLIEGLLLNKSVAIGRRNRPESLYFS